MQAHLTHYNEDQHSSHNALDSVIFSEDVLCHLIRMHRILSYHHGLVGSSRTNVGYLVYFLLCFYDVPKSL